MNTLLVGNTRGEGSRRVPDDSEVTRKAMEELPQILVRISASKTYTQDDLFLVSGSRVLAEVRSIYTVYLRTVAPSGVIALYIRFSCAITYNGWYPGHDLSNYLGATLNSRTSTGETIDSWRLGSLNMICRGTMSSYFASAPKPDFYDLVTGAYLEVDSRMWYQC